MATEWRCQTLNLHRNGADTALARLVGVFRRHKLLFFVTILVGLSLRLFFVFQFPCVAGDGLVYSDIARNLLNRGIYGLTDANIIRPTLIRLPGYPGFLALVFALLGHHNYTAVMVIQAFIDIGSCTAISLLTMEMSNAKAARTAYVLAAICPFTAIYCAAILTETLAIFCTVNALYCGVKGIKAVQVGSSFSGSWIAAGVWSGIGLLVRPDGGFVHMALYLTLLVLLFTLACKRLVLLAGLLLGIVSLSPLVPWTIRNWRQFHVFQPLVTVDATDPGEFSEKGFTQWAKSWVVDYASVVEVEWPMDGEPIDFHTIPDSAFDTRDQRERTEKLIADYNDSLSLDAVMDTRFAGLAQERIHRNPFRYYVWLPCLRITDMWLRPRTEILPIATRWWEFAKHPNESFFALSWAAVNLCYLLAALRGWLKLRMAICGVAIIGYILIRSAYLSTIFSPEPRYVLECFPTVIMLAGVGVSSMNRKCSSCEQTKLVDDRIPE